MRTFVLSDDKQNMECMKTIQTTIGKSTFENNIDLRRTSLHAAQVNSCVGCFGCWIKTPGECVLKDNGRDILKDFVQSDLSIIISPIQFGNYSFSMKSAIDRFIPNDIYKFTKYKGETHHVKRYQERPNILFIGISEKQNQAYEDTFVKLCNKNAVNFRATKHSVLVVQSSEEQAFIEEKVQHALADFFPKMEVEI